MLWRAFLLGSVTIAIAVLISNPAMAQDEDVIHYQGVLLGSGGDPVEDGTYEINFTIWDEATGGVQSLWSETHNVQVIDGKFDVDLGTTSPLLPQIFTHGVDGECQDGIVFLEVQVAGDEPMTPRLQMGKAPTSFASKRIDGDVVSGPGQLFIVNEGLIGEHPYCELTSDEFHASISLADPRPTPVFPDLSLMADESGTRITTGGLIGTHPFFELRSDFSEAGLSLADPRPTPVFPDLSIVADESGTRITTGGLIDTHPYFELFSDFSEVGLSLADPRPTPQFPDITIKGDENGGSITIASPDPESEFDGIELRSGQSSSLVIGLPRPPRPGDPINIISSDQSSSIIFGDIASQEETIIIQTDDTGGGMEFRNDAGLTEWKVEDGESMIFDPETDGKTVTHCTGLDIYNSSGDLTAQFNLEGIIASAGNFGLDNTNIGITAFVAGSGNSATGDYSTVGGGQNNHADEDYSTVAGGQNNTADGLGSFVGGGYQNTASGGHSVVAGGNFNLNQGNYSAIPGGYADTITTSAYMSYLFGIGSKLTADSTFMVDMPHVRFGDQTDGYEFPASDGENGQMLVTDGHGQLSWSSHMTVVDDKLERVIQENRELKNLVSRLERRIMELEKR